MYSFLSSWHVSFALLRYEKRSSLSKRIVITTSYKIVKGPAKAMRSTFFSGRVTNPRHAYNALELLPRLRHFTDAESLRSKADIPPLSCNSPSISSRLTGGFASVFMTGKEESSMNRPTQLISMFSLFRGMTVSLKIIADERVHCFFVRLSPSTMKSSSIFFKFIEEFKSDKKVLIE